MALRLQPPVNIVYCILARIKIVNILIKRDRLKILEQFILIERFIEYIIVKYHITLEDESEYQPYGEYKIQPIETI